MMTTEFIKEHFDKTDRFSNRWQFEPSMHSAGLSHRYFLQFHIPERRFLLSRVKIVPFEGVNDAELLAAFRGTLTEEEVAGCMRSAMTTPPDDAIPF